MIVGADVEYCVIIDHHFEELFQVEAFIFAMNRRPTAGQRVMSSHHYRLGFTGGVQVSFELGQQFRLSGVFKQDAVRISHNEGEGPKIKGSCIFVGQIIQFERRVEKHEIIVCVVLVVASHEDAGPHCRDLAQHYEKAFVTDSIIGTEIVSIVASKVHHIRLVLHFQQVIESVVEPIVYASFQLQVPPIAKCQHFYVLLIPNQM